MAENKEEEQGGRKEEREGGKGSRVGEQREGEEKENTDSPVWGQAPSMETVL